MNLSEASGRLFQISMNRESAGSIMPTPAPSRAGSSGRCSRIRRGASCRSTPVLSVVLYNGRRSRWTAAVEVGEMIAPVEVGLVWYQPSLRIAEVHHALLDAGDREGAAKWLADVSVDVIAQLEEQLEEGTARK